MDRQTLLIASDVLRVRLYVGHGRAYVRIYYSETLVVMKYIQSVDMHHLHCRRTWTPFCVVPSFAVEVFIFFSSSGDQYAFRS